MQKTLKLGTVTLLGGVLGLGACSYITQYKFRNNTGDALSVMRVEEAPPYAVEWKRLSHGRSLEFVDYGKRRTLLVREDGLPYGFNDREITAEKPVFLSVRQDGCTQRYRIDGGLPKGQPNTNKAMRTVVIQIDKTGQLAYQMSRKEGADLVARAAKAVGFPISPVTECAGTP